MKGPFTVLVQIEGPFKIDTNSVNIETKLAEPDGEPAKSYNWAWVLGIVMVVGLIGLAVRRK